MDPHRTDIATSSDAPALLRRRAASGVGVAALAHLLGDDRLAQRRRRRAVAGLPGLPHFAPKAKRVIYLFQSGGPSQIDLFDYKPKLAKLPRRRSCPTRSARASG